MTVKTFFPRTVAGVQNIIRWGLHHLYTIIIIIIIIIIRSANSIGARVRASATRHTFNPWLWGVESNVQPGTQVCCYTVLCYTVILS